MSDRLGALLAGLNSELEFQGETQGNIKVLEFRREGDSIYGVAATSERIYLSVDSLDVEGGHLWASVPISDYHSLISNLGVTPCLEPSGAPL